MDINHILEREQVSLHNAKVATSSPARIAHEQLATAYGALLTDTAFPHRSGTSAAALSRAKQHINEWENEGGAAGLESPNLAKEDKL